MKVNERREHVQKFRLCFNCLKPGHMSKNCRSRTCSVPSCGRRHNRLLHSEPPKKETAKNVSDATTAVAPNVTQGGLPVVLIKLTNRDLSLNVLAMCDSGSSISFVDKSVVSKLQLQGRKAALSVAGIHGSQDVKTEIVPIAVSAHEKSRPLTTVQFYVHEKLKLGDQIVELQELKDRYPHLRNLPDQSYNLNDVQVILGQDCYDIHHPFEFKKSEDKAALWAVKSKIGWALSGPLPAKQAATLATTATSIADDKLANQLSKWWDIESYASNCDVTGHSKEGQRAVKTLERTTRFNGERYEVGLWTTPTERRGAKEALPRNHRHRCQRWIRSESRSSWTEWNQRQTAMVFITSSRHKPAQTRKSQKSVQRSSKVSRCSPKRQTSTWARPVAEFDRNHISLPRTPNSLISRYRSNVTSSSCPKGWQPMFTIPLERRSRAENRNLRVHTTRFLGEKLADLCKLRLAPSGER